MCGDRGDAQGPDGVPPLAAQRITGMTHKYRAGREWEYPLVEEAMEAARFHPIGVYIKRQKMTIADRVACRPVYSLYTEAERMPDTNRLLQWWEQDGVNEPG